MKQGIHLGPAKTGNRLLRVIVSVAVIGTIAHWGLLLRERNELDAAEADAEYTVTVPDLLALSESQLQVLQELGAVARSGLLDTLSVTRVLHEVEKTLPDGVALIGASLVPTPPAPTLTLEAWARDEDAVARLEDSMVRSERVLVTRLLEERPARDGGLSIRLQVDLAPVASGVETRSSLESADSLLEAAP